MDETKCQRIRELVNELHSLLNETDAPPPSNISSIRPETEEFTGTIHRPKFSVVKGRSLWTAGIGIANGNSKSWKNVTAWANLAEQCKSLQRGACVHVIAEPKREGYLDKEGVMQYRTNYTMADFDLVRAASSAASG